MLIFKIYGNVRLLGYAVNAGYFGAQESAKVCDISGTQANKRLCGKIKNFESAVKIIALAIWIVVTQASGEIYIYIYNKNLFASIVKFLRLH